MEKSQVTAIVNKIKGLGDIAYKSIQVKTTSVESYRLFSESSYGYFDDSNECVVIVRLNANPVRYTMHEDQIEVNFVDYSDISKITCNLNGQELRENKDAFDGIDEENINSLIKFALMQHQAEGFNTPKDDERNWSITKPKDENGEVKKSPLRPGDVIGAPSIF